MPFPTRPTAQEALDRGQTVARRLKDFLQRERQKFAGQTVPRSAVRATLDQLVHARTVMMTVESTPGLLEYAREQYADSGLDIVAEWQAMRAAIDTAGAWIVTNYPKSGNGALEELEFNAEGRTVERTFTPAQLGGLVTQIDAVVATIN